MQTDSWTAKMSPDSAAEVDEVAAYRPLSALALAALVLGILAPLSFAAPLMMAIPLAGMVVGAVALWQIAESGGVMVGRAAAIVGLALSVASAGAAVSRSAIKEELLSRQARAVALRWCELLGSGDVAGAFAMTTEGMRPASPPPPDSPFPAEPPPDPLTQFRENPVVAFLATHGGHTTVRFDRDLEPSDGVVNPYRNEQLFVAEDAQHAGQSPITLTITTQRSRIDGRDRWVVAGFRSDELPTVVDHDHDHAHHHHE